MRRRQGFTLLELFVVIIIVGVLATLSIQQFRPARESALSREAVSNLRLILAAERIYRMENDSFYPPSGIVNSSTAAGLTAINSELRLNLSAANWVYSIAGGINTFSATADRAGAGGYLNCLWLISQNGEPPVISAGPCAQ